MPDWTPASFICHRAGKLLTKINVNVMKVEQSALRTGCKAFPAFPASAKLAPLRCTCQTRPGRFFSALACDPTSSASRGGRGPISQNQLKLSLGFFNDGQTLRNLWTRDGFWSPDQPRTQCHQAHLQGQSSACACYCERDAQAHSRLHALPAQWSGSKSHLIG